MTFGLSAGALAAGVMAGGAVAGGVISANGAKDAANTQAGAANNATQAQLGMFDQTVGLESPFRSAGVSANDKLSGLLGINTSADKTQDNFDASAYLAANPDVAKDRYYAAHPWQHYQDYGQGEGRQFTFTQGKGPSAPAGGSDPSSFGSLLKPFDMNDFQMDPGTQFRIKYGNQALQNSQAAQNGVMSGSALKDLIGFNQDYAGLGYQSAFDRYMANKSFTLGSLNDLANRGQAAAGNTVNNAGSFSSGMANTITGAGNASAAGTVGSANALSGAVSGAGNAYMLRNMLGGGGGNSGQAALSQTAVGGSGFGTGLAYGNQDMGQYL